MSEDIMCGVCQKALLESKYTDIPPLVCGHIFSLHQSRLASAEALIGECEKALLKYGKHYDCSPLNEHCPANNGEPCTCGLNKSLDSIKRWRTQKER